jgi:hypothetical protein
LYLNRDTSSLDLMEADIFWTHRQMFHLGEPFSSAEIRSRPDAMVWRAAVEREKAILDEIDVFKEVVLPREIVLLG